MKRLDWNAEKNEKLKAGQGVCFEDVAAVIRKQEALAVIMHPNQVRYPGQMMFVVAIKGYAYVVPFVRDGEMLFLKTVIPSRKATKKYINNR